MSSQRAEREEIDTPKRERYPLVATGKGVTTFRDDHERNGDDVDSIGFLPVCFCIFVSLSIIRFLDECKNDHVFPPARDGASINTIA